MEEDDEGENDEKEKEKDVPDELDGVRRSDRAKSNKLKRSH